jgi:hypothetical protein
MAIFNRKTQPDPATLEARIVTARAAMETASAEHAAAALHAADGLPGGEARLSKARSALQDATSTLHDLEAAVVGARARQAAAARAEQEADKARRWNQAERLAKGLGAEAVRVEQAVAELADAFGKLQRGAAELHGIAPADVNRILSSQLSPDELVGHLKRELKRTGMGWAQRFYPWSVDITFSAKISEAIADFLRSRQGGKA